MFFKVVRKRTKLASIGKKFRDTTTIHGIGHTCNSSFIVIRIFWLLALGLATLFCGFTLYNTIAEYFAFDVITVTKEVEEDRVIFPAVTICAPKAENEPLENQLTLDFIDSCSFDGSACDLTADFERFTLDQRQFMCLRYNGNHMDSNGKNYRLKTVKSNSFNTNSGALSLIFNIGTEYILFYVHDNFLNAYRFLPEYSLNKNENLRVYVSKTVDKKLEWPHNPCRVSEYPAYRQDNCRERCISDRIAEDYNCSINGYYRNEQMDGSDWTVYSNKWMYNVQCTNNCEKECMSTKYNLAFLPGKAEPANVSRIVMLVSLSQKSHLQLTQTAKTTFWDLLSSIGGTFGFLGMSFLSFVEIFELVIELLVVCFFG